MRRCASCTQVFSCSGDPGEVHCPKCDPKHDYPPSVAAAKVRGGTIGSNYEMPNPFRRH